MFAESAKISMLECWKDVADRKCGDEWVRGIGKEMFFSDL